MATLEEWKDRAIDLAQAGVAKTKELTGIAKLTLANSAEEDSIKKAYQEIGKLYYAERGLAPDEAYVSLCRKITLAKERIEENKAKIAELKAQRDGQDVEDQETATPQEQVEEDGQEESYQQED